MHIYHPLYACLLPTLPLNLGLGIRVFTSLSHLPFDLENKVHFFHLFYVWCLEHQPVNLYCLPQGNERLLILSQFPHHGRCAESNQFICRGGKVQITWRGENFTCQKKSMKLPECFGIMTMQSMLFTAQKVVGFLYRRRHTNGQAALLEAVSPRNSDGSKHIKHV